MVKYFLLSLLAYYVYHTFIAPPKPNYRNFHGDSRNNESGSESKSPKSKRKDTDFTEYEEIK